MLRKTVVYCVVAMLMLVSTHLFANPTGQSNEKLMVQSAVKRLGRNYYRTVFTFPAQSGQAKTVATSVDTNSEIYDYGASVVKESNDNYSETNSFLVGKRDGNIYRSYMMINIGDVGRWAHEYGIDILQTQMQMDLLFFFPTNSGWTQTVKLKCGQLDGTGTSYAETNYGVIGQASQTASYEITDYSGGIWNFQSNGNSALDQYIESLRNQDESTLFLFYQASDESFNGQEINGMQYDKSVDITPDSLIIYWQYENPPLYVANSRGNTIINGTLTIDDLDESGVEFPGIYSDSDVPANPSHQYRVTTDSIRLTQRYTSDRVQDHHWQTNNNTDQYDQWKQSITFDYDFNNYSDIRAQFQKIYPVQISASANVPLEIQDPWLSQNTNDYAAIQAGTHQVFLNQGDPGNPNSDAPYYRLRAPMMGEITQTEIYTFDHWEGTNVDFGNGNTATNRTTSVVFLNDSAHVEAVYTPANERENYTLTIPANQTLTIPAGGNYQFADHFRMKIAGNLQIGDGSAGVKFSSTSPEPDFGLLSNDEPTTLDTLIVIDGENKNIQIQNLEIDNAYGGIAIRGTNQTVRLNNVEIAHTNIGILLDKLVNADILFDHLKIHDTDLGISFGKQLAAADQESYIDIYWSLFYDNNRSSIYMFPTDYFERPSGSNSQHWLTLVNCTFWESPASTNYGAFYSHVPPISGNDDFDHYYGKIDINVYNSIFQNIGLDLNHHNFTLSNFCEGNLVYGLDPDENPFDDPPFDPPAALVGDPAFNNVSQRDFRLHHWSPAIDMGVYRAEWMTYLDEPDPSDPYDIGAIPYRFIRGEMEPGLAVWDGGDFDITGDLLVPEGSTLDIKAGTHIYVHPGVHVQVIGGQLLSEGNSTDSVVFRSSQPDPWAGLEITKGTGEIKYTNIQQAEKGLVVDQSQGQLSRSTIQQNTSGVILTHTSKFDIYDNAIQDNSTGLQLLYSPVTVKGNSIQTNGGTGLYLYRSDADVIQNQIQNNRTGVAIENLSNASFVTTEDPNTLYLNNTITDNNDYGVTIDAGSNPLLGMAKQDTKGHWTGGFNVIHSNKTGDIEANNKDKVDARLNWWDGKPVIDGTGSLILDPTADDQFGPPKGLSKSVTEGETSSDTLDPRLAAAVALELDSAYTEAVQAYQAIITSAPDSAIAQTALGGIVRCYYRQDNLAELLNTLTTLSETNAGSALSTLADDYAMTAQAMVTQYETAMEIGDAVYDTYASAGTNPEAAAAVLFEQVLIAADMDSTAGLGKWNSITRSQVTRKKLDTIVGKYHDTEAAKLVQLLFNKSSQKAVAPPLPSTVMLENAYPNPFNPTTTISYGLPKDQPVTLIVYDLTGRQVKTLVNAQQSAGMHSIQWDGTNSHGQQVSSGVYFYQLTVSKTVKTHKMLLIR